jgi:hypothetical protein
MMTMLDWGVAHASEPTAADDVPRTGGLSSETGRPRGGYDRLIDGPRASCSRGQCDDEGAAPVSGSPDDGGETP